MLLATGSGAVPSAGHWFEGLVLRPEFLPERRLFVHQNENVASEPEQRGIYEQVHLGE
jgi:hypothetical protein